MTKLLTRVYRQIIRRTDKRGKSLEPVLIHGTAAGADQMAATIWIELGGTVEPHPADWDKYGRRAGFVRNAEMVQAGPDLCIAFIRAESRGATMCAKLAERAEIKTWRITAA